MIKKTTYIWSPNGEDSVIVTKLYLLGFIKIYESSTTFDYEIYEGENEIQELKNIAESCGNCKYFSNEDSIGSGYCAKLKNTTHCPIIGYCKKHKFKKP